MKLASFVTGKSKVIAMKGAFHGRTSLAVAATDNPSIVAPVNRTDHVVFVPLNDEAALEAAFEGGDVSSVIIENIQGVGGVRMAGEGFVRKIRSLCDRYGALYIADEVQCGIFRSGKPFAFQTYGVEPDIMSLAKGIADGVPMGAVVAKKEIADVFKPGDHGSTFGGSCLAIAACAATLSALVRGDYADHAAKVGAYMEAKLAKLPNVTEVRGRGLMLGCDLDDTAGDAHDVVARALGAGAVINATGAHTLRFLPPLVCEESDVDSLIEILSDVLA